MVAGLAERFTVQVGHLVGADDHGFGEAGGHGVGFFEGQANGQVARRFAGQRCFVHLGRVHVEGQSQAGKQFAAVARGRGEDHGALHGTIVREPPESLGFPSGLSRAGEARGALDWRG
jgi:hypothetical protein